MGSPWIPPYTSFSIVGSQLRRAARLEQAAKKEVSYADFLDELLAAEVGSKTQH